MQLSAAFAVLAAALALPAAPPPAAAPGPAPLAVHIGQPPPFQGTPGTKSPGGAVSKPGFVPADASTSPGGASSGSGSGNGGTALSGLAATTRTGGGRDRSVRGMSGRNGATTATAAPQIVLDTWQLWWAHNRDEFLDIKSRQPAATTVSGSPGQLTGRGRRITRPSGHRPSSDRMDAEVVPALLQLLSEHSERELLNSASLAVGRMASPQLAALVSERLVALLAHDERQVQASATLGLGALGAAGSDVPLLALLRDDSAGRRLTGGGEVDRLPRSISALSLGLLGDARSVWSLLDIVRRLPDRESEVKACAIAGLSLLPADSPRTALAKTLLAELLTDRKLDPIIASVIPTTLAKLGARESIPLLMQVLDGKDSDRLVRQSVIIGLGHLATLDDALVVEALMNEVLDGRDASARQFGLIALGYMGAHASPDAEAHGRLRGLLEREFSGRGRRQQRSWAALSAAIYARGQISARDALLPALRKAHQDENDPAARAAFTLALGLVRDSLSTQALREDLLSADLGLAGYAAVALGLLDDRESIGAMRTLLHRKGATPSLRTRVSTALALLVDVESVPGLVALLKSGVTHDEQAALSKAIGLIGDERAVAPLLALALDEGARIHDRGFACVALGLLGERTRLPFQAGLRAGTNYLARIDPLVQVAQLL